MYINCMRKVITLFILLFMLGCSINVRSTIDVPVNVAAETNLDVDVIVGEQIVGEAQGTFLFDRLCIQCPSEYTAGVFGGKYSINNDTNFVLTMLRKANNNMNINS